jgi:WD40 repeat protein/predicted Ser/Thr protein kinase
MTLAEKCPRCGTVLSADVFAGLCPKCLGQLGFSPAANSAADAGLLRLGDYELLEEIARGGMGVVYRARQLSLNRVVAVKVVLHGPFASAEFVRRFRTEAEAAAALRHPNIVSIHEVGERDGHHFLSMEYIEGQNFAELVREKPLPARRAAGYLKTIAEAVQHAHQRGVLHRDLKPSNVLLDVFDQPRVTDFGLAKLVNHDAEITTTGQVLGSPNHMPPEQAAGKFSDSSPQSDVYSLGAILYQLLTSRPPFQGETLQEILAQVQNVEPIPPRRLNPSVPADLQTICLKCLQKEPAHRYRSAQELADDLGRFLASEPIHARPVPLAERAWLWCKRRPVFAALSAALVVTVAFGLAGILWQWRRAEVLRLVAEENAAKTRLNLYASDVALASRAMQRGDFGLARRTLDALRPKPDEPDLRGFEWRYLWNLCRGDQLATFTGHTWIVTCAAFSPDGNRIATGSQDGTARIWDVAKRESVVTLKVSDHAAWSVAFTPDGKVLMTADTDGVQFWSTDSWRVITNYPGKVAALSKDGTLLATADSSPFSWERAGAVTLWNWRTGQMLRHFDRPGRALVLSPDGSRLAVADRNTGINLFDSNSGKLLRTFATENPVWSLNFSPDGKRLASAGWSGEVSVWIPDDDSPPRKISGHRLNVWSAVFSPDGATIATTGSDQTVRLWDAATLQPKTILYGHNSEVWCAAFSPDGKQLATGGKDQNVMLWPTDVTARRDALPHANEIRSIFSPDGTRLITVNPNSGWTSALWNSDDRTLIAKTLANGQRVVGFSPDGKQVVAFDGDENALEFWQPEGGEPERRVVLEGVSKERAQFIFRGMSPEQQFFFATDKAGVVRIWNADTGRLLATIKGPEPPIRNAVLGPKGRHFAVSVERENFVRLYDCGSLRELRLAGHRDFVSGLAFSPDDATFVTGSMDGTIRLWETATGRQTASLPGHMQETTDVAFSPDGRTLASLSQSESLKLWHLPTLREVFTEEFPHAGIQDVVCIGFADFVKPECEQTYCLSDWSSAMLSKFFNAALRNIVTCSAPTKFFSKTLQQCWKRF